MSSSESEAPNGRVISRPCLKKLHSPSETRSEVRLRSFNSSETDDSVGDEKGDAASVNTSVSVLDDELDFSGAEGEF